MSHLAVINIGTSSPSRPSTFSRDITMTTFFHAGKGIIFAIETRRFSGTETQKENRNSAQFSSSQSVVDQQMVLSSVLQVQLSFSERLQPVCRSLKPSLSQCRFSSAYSSINVRFPLFNSPGNRFIQVSH
jgi:hypothetical protein